MDKLSIGLKSVWKVAVLKNNQQHHTKWKMPRLISSWKNSCSISFKIQMRFIKIREERQFNKKQKKKPMLCGLSSDVRFEMGSISGNSLR
jgi:hypothetical protein